MQVPKKYQDEVAKLRRGLYIVWDDKAGWNEPYGRWVVRFKDDRNGLDRKAVVVQDDEGNYKDLNMGVLRMLKGSIRWDLVEKFPDPEKLYHELEREHKAAKAAVTLERHAALKAFNKDNKRMIREVMQNIKQGILH